MPVVAVVLILISEEQRQEPRTFSGLACCINANSRQTLTADTEYGTSWKLKPNEWQQVYVESWHKVPEVKPYNKGSFWNRNSGDDIICEQCEFTFTIV